MSEVGTPVQDADRFPTSLHPVQTPGHSQSDDLKGVRWTCPDEYELRPQTQQSFAVRPFDYDRGVPVRVNRRRNNFGRKPAYETAQIPDAVHRVTGKERNSDLEPGGAEGFRTGDDWAHLHWPNGWTRTTSSRAGTSRLTHT